MTIHENERKPKQQARNQWQLAAQYFNTVEAILIAVHPLIVDEQIEIDQRNRIGANSRPAFYPQCNEDAGIRLGLNCIAKPLIEISRGLDRLAIGVLRGYGDPARPGTPNVRPPAHIGPPLKS